MKNILIATGEAHARRSIAGCFPGEYAIDNASDAATVRRFFKVKPYEFAFIDAGLLVAADGAAAGSPAAALEELWTASPGTEIVVLAPPQQVHDAVEAVRNGANSYLIHPVAPAEVRYVVESTLESGRSAGRLDQLRDSFWKPEARPYVVTYSPLMRKSLEAARSVAPTNSTVLLSGETGTGKGLLSELIHAHSPRAEGPFVSVHCGALPETLIESELFGHEKGSFTSASEKRLGKFETARNGTIFLDEVGTMTPEAQVKLLRVLEDRVFQRVGGDKDIEADVRVVTATNVDLLKMCEDGRFRRDLFYRLNVFPIEIPPLRERREDIPHLAAIFLDKLNAAYGKNIADFHRLVLKGFNQYSWPGNIRELGNVIERAYILETANTLSPYSFPQELIDADAAASDLFVDGSATLAEVRQRAIEEAERKYLEEKLAEHHGRVDKTADAAGITPRQLHKLMTKYGIRKEDFKI